MFELRIRNLFAGRKKRIGVGPIMEGEVGLGNRKWYIDPLVNYINHSSKKYVADIYFFESSDIDRDISRFDLVVFLKFTPELIVVYRHCEVLNTKKVPLVYIVSDNAVQEISYLNCEEIATVPDSIIVQNPVVEEEMREKNSNVHFIRPALITKRFKSEYATRKEVRIYWDGYCHNLWNVDRLKPIIERLSQEVSVPIKMFFFVNLPAKEEGVFQYVPYSLRRWEEMMINADIAVSLKITKSHVHKRKPPSKLQTYMAAGLPVVCTPSPADEVTIEHGKTGFFAYTDEDWYNYLKLLIEDAPLREKIGRAAREAALRMASIDVIGEKYIEIFDKLLGERAG